MVEEVEVEEEVGRWYNGRHCRGAEMLNTPFPKQGEEIRRVSPRRGSRQANWTVNRAYNCRGAEMADRLVSKTSEGNLVRVRLPLPALNLFFHFSLSHLTFLC